MGVFRGGLSTVISPPLSRSRSTRRLISRLTPIFRRVPLGRGKVRLLAFQDRWRSSIQTKVVDDFVVVAACWIHHRGTFTKGSTFRFFLAAASSNSDCLRSAEASITHAS